MKRILLLNTLCVFIFGLLTGQEAAKSIDVQNYSNIVKNSVFVSQDQYFPMTVLISPFGYWYYGQIKYGLCNYDNIDYLKEARFGWQESEICKLTPSDYFFDTLSVDTVYSLFINPMCEGDDFFIHKCYTDSVLNNSKSINNMINEYKFTYLLQDMYLDTTESIHVLYSHLSDNGYHDLFFLVSLHFFADSIKMISYRINTTNLLNIYSETIDSVYLSDRESQRIIKKLSTSLFDKKIDCSLCNQFENNQYSFLIDYNRDGLHSTFFLCDNIVSKSKMQKIILNNLKGLKSIIIQLNNKHFGSKLNLDR